MLASKTHGGTEMLSYPRISYIEINASIYSPEINILVNLSDSTYNSGAVEYSDVLNYYDLISFSGYDLDTESRPGNPNLYDGIKVALSEFEKGKSDFLGRSKKIVIFSSSEVSNITELCNEYGDLPISTNSTEFIMVNFGNNIPSVDEYISCLTPYDESKIFLNTDRNKDFYDS